MCRGTLRGFASIAFVDLHMVVQEIAIHEKNGKSWAQPPARPWLKDGVAVKGDNGKIIYSPPLIEFAYAQGALGLVGCGAAPGAGVRPARARMSGGRGMADRTIRVDLSALPPSRLWRGATPR